MKHPSIFKFKMNNNNNGPNFEDSIGDEAEEEGDLKLDPSVLVPEGVSRRIRKATLECPPDVKIIRPAMTVVQKHAQFNYQKPAKPSFRDNFKSSLKKKTQCSRDRVKKALFLRLPILDWLFHYKIQRDLLNDVISGVTVAVMNIPQGMAYAMLANLDPIYGIYMAFFPVLIYATFATSRHCSMGTFAVVCIMTGQVVTQLATPENENSLLNADANSQNSSSHYSPIEVATMVSFSCSMWMFIFGIFNLGSLSVFLSDMLVSGFTTGAAIHVLTSQVPKLFGLPSPSYQGLFKIPKTWFDIFRNILESNSATMVISLLCLAVLVLNNEVLKPRLRKKTRLPFPIELVVVIFGAVASYYGDLNEKYRVETVGDIPTGFPPPSIPRFELFGQIIISSLTISIVSFSVSFSMAKIFAKKRDYTVDATQELYATGLGNLMGSFFSCAPIAASLSRSLVQETVGGATQLASYISCILLAFVLLFIGPYFSTLPNSVLAAIIAVALKGMFLQFSDFSRMWKVSKADASTWLITFLSVVILDIDYGLMVGIMAVLLLLIIRNRSFKITLLGRISDTDIYLDKSRYPSVSEIPGIKICHVLGSLHFANQESFRQTLAKVSGIDPKIILKWKKKQEKLFKRKLNNEKGANNVGEDLEKNERNPNVNAVKYKSNSIEFDVNNTDENINKNLDKLKSTNCDAVSKVLPEVASLIVDLCGVSQIDISAATNLAALHKEFTFAGVALIFTGISEPALEIMGRCQAINELPEEVFFHTVPDAVAYLTTPVVAPSANSSTDIVLHL